MKHCVYILQNIINLKIYVGYSSNPHKRWRSEKSSAINPKDRDYSTLLSRAIRKYGWDNFTKNIIEEYDSSSDALDAEKFWIEFFRTNVKLYGPDYGYNLDAGGGLPPNHTGRKRSEKTKKLISEANKDKIISPEQRKIISDNNKNRIVSEETRKKLSEIGKNKIFTEETKKLISDSKSGKTFSETHKQNISLSKMGGVPWNKGIPTNDETKNKISQSNRKLTDEQINNISIDTRPIKIIANDYGVSKITISRIRKKFKGF